MSIAKPNWFNFTQAKTSSPAKTLDPSLRLPIQARDVAYS